MSTTFKLIKKNPVSNTNQVKVNFEERFALVLNKHYKNGFILNSSLDLDWFREDYKREFEVENLDFDDQSIELIIRNVSFVYKDRNYEKAFVYDYDFFVELFNSIYSSFFDEGLNRDNIRVKSTVIYYDELFETLKSLFNENGIRENDINFIKELLEYFANNVISTIPNKEHNGGKVYGDFDKKYCIFQIEQLNWDKWEYHKDYDLFDLNDESYIRIFDKGLVYLFLSNERDIYEKELILKVVFNIMKDYYVDIFKVKDVLKFIPYNRIDYVIKNAKEYLRRI